MIRGRTLHGRAVIDLDAGEKLGTVAEVGLDPPCQRMAGLIVLPWRAAFSSGREVLLPASAVHAIKPGAVMARRAGDAGRFAGRLEELPRLSQLSGRTV